MVLCQKRGSDVSFSKIQTSVKMKHQSLVGIFQNESLVLNSVNETDFGKPGWNSIKLRTAFQQCLPVLNFTSRTHIRPPHTQHQTKCYMKKTIQMYQDQTDWRSFPFGWISRRGLGATVNCFDKRLILHGSASIMTVFGILVEQPYCVSVNR